MSNIKKTMAYIIAKRDISGHFDYAILAGKYKNPFMDNSDDVEFIIEAKKLFLINDKNEISDSNGKIDVSELNIDLMDFDNPVTEVILFKAYNKNEVESYFGNISNGDISIAKNQIIKDNINRSLKNKLG
jgi:hypothetical protein